MLPGFLDGLRPLRRLRVLKVKSFCSNVSMENPTFQLGANNAVRALFTPAGFNFKLSSLNLIIMDLLKPVCCQKILQQRV